jgi:hypothetical protein
LEERTKTFETIYIAAIAAINSLRSRQRFHMLSTIYLSNSVTVLPEKHPTRDCPNGTPAQRNLPYLCQHNLSNHTMVFSAPAPGAGSSKRPAPCMQDDVNRWDNVPVSDTSIGNTYMELTHLLHSPWVYQCVHRSTSLTPTTP